MPRIKGSASHVFLGKEVAKAFPVDDREVVFFGKITKYFPAEDADDTDLWHIKYEDGDEEDQDHSEVTESIALAEEERERQQDEEAATEAAKKAKKPTTRKSPAAQVKRPVGRGARGRERGDSAAGPAGAAGVAAEAAAAVGPVAAAEAAAAAGSVGVEIEASAAMVAAGDNTNGAAAAAEAATAAAVEDGAAAAAATALGSLGCDLGFGTKRGWAEEESGGAGSGSSGGSHGGGGDAALPLVKLSRLSEDFVPLDIASLRPEERPPMAPSKLKEAYFQRAARDLHYNPRDFFDPTGEGRARKSASSGGPKAVMPDGAPAASPC